MTDRSRRVSGAVVWRDTAAGPEVLLVHQRADGEWALPKGGARRRESDEDCAVREVEEETGFRCTLQSELPQAFYVDATGAGRTVRYWAATPVSGAFEPNAEVDDICWLPASEALARLTEPRERPMVVALARLLAEDGIAPGRRLTRMILLRRAAVLQREHWAGPDDARPLRDEGRDEAERLRALGDLFEISTVLSSPARRCVETVEPLADSLGLEVEVLDGLADRDAAAALRVVRRVQQRGVVLCTHESVIRGVLETLMVTDGLVIADRIRRRRASAWCLEFDGATCVGATYLPSPHVVPAADLAWAKEEVS